LDDWGFNGPIIGPVQLSWVYGNLRIHPLNYESFVFLPITSTDLVRVDGKFYGDFEVLLDNDPLLLKAIKEGRQLLNYEEFSTVINPI
jgi:hypothetical protein